MGGGQMRSPPTNFERKAKRAHYSGKHQEKAAVRGNEIIRESPSTAGGG